MFLEVAAFLITKLIFKFKNIFEVLKIFIFDFILGDTKGYLLEGIFFTVKKKIFCQKKSHFHLSKIKFFENGGDE